MQNNAAIRRNNEINVFIQQVQKMQWATNPKSKPHPEEEEEEQLCASEMNRITQKK